MSDVSATSGARRHFTDESTNQVLHRDLDVSVDVHGRDKTQRQVKEHQQGEVGAPGALSVAHAVAEGGHIAEFHFIGAAGELGLGVGLPIAGLAFGIYEGLEAIKKGEEQNAAVARENMHVAILGTLDLPEGYKIERKARDFPGVPTGNQSVAFKMTEKLAADGPGRATLQLQCDRGIHAAKDLIASGTSVDAFLKTNPKVAEAYAKDAAFHEGFNAYFHAAGQAGGAMKKEMDDGLARRDGWYAQANVSVRA